MRKFMCKVFRFLLDLVSQVVSLVAQTLIMIGTAVVEVLSEVAGAIGGALLKNPVVLGLIGVGLYMFLSGRKEDDKAKPTTVRELSNVIAT